MLAIRNDKQYVFLWRKLKRRWDIWFEGQLLNGQLVSKTIFCPPLSYSILQLFNCHCPWQQVPQNIQDEDFLKILYTLKLENSSADRNISERATNNGLTVCQYNSFHMWSVEKYFELPTQNSRSYFYRIFIQMQNKDWQMYKCRNETLFPLVVPQIVADWQAADPLPSPHSVSEVFCFLFLRFCLFCSTYCQQNLWKKHTTPYFGWNASPKRNVGEKIMFDGTSRDCFCHTVIFVNFLIKIKWSSK